MFLLQWCVFVLAYLVVSPQRSVNALYGTQLTGHATDHRGVKAPQMEEFENQVQ